MTFRVDDLNFAQKRLPVSATPRQAAKNIREFYEEEKGESCKAIRARRRAPRTYRLAAKHLSKH